MTVMIIDGKTLPPGEGTRSFPLGHGACQSVHGEWFFRWGCGGSFFYLTSGSYLLLGAWLGGTHFSPLLFLLYWLYIITTTKQQIESELQVVIQEQVRR